jgi:hypothetical protein
MFNYSRISVAMYMTGNFPFCCVLGVDGSNDLAIKHPDVAISTYPEVESVGTNFA